MHPSLTIAVAVLLVLVGGCRPSAEGGADSASGDDVQALLAVDREWARLASSGGSVDSIVAFWDDDARVAIGGAPMVQGKPAIREMVARDMATPGFHITWSPEGAVVSRSGDLGYTYGSNEITIPGPTGTTARKMAGRYLTVWRKGADGRWRCVMDYSSPGPEAAPPTRR